MRSFIISTINNCIRIVRKSCRYIRLTPYQRGKIIYYDKRSKELISFISRGYDDSVTLDAIFLNDEYNLQNLKRYSEIRAYYDDALQSGQTVSIIDCGANIGAASIYFTREFPEAKIYSFEPDHENFKTLNQNCCNNSSIKSFRAAVGSVDCYGALDKSISAPNGKRVIISKNHTDTKILSLQTIMKNHKINRPFIVKIDIEGFERDLFEVNTEWIDRTDIIIIEPHDWLLPKQKTFRNFLSVISRKNRDFIIHKENIISISNKNNLSNT